MTGIPESNEAMVAFFEERVPLWLATPGDVGLDPDQVEELYYLVRNAKQELMHADRGTLPGSDDPDPIGMLRVVGAELIEQIQEFAEFVGSPERVCARSRVADIECDRNAMRMPPGKPEKISVTLQENGDVSLSWVGTIAQTTAEAYFVVSRKLPGEVGFRPVGDVTGVCSPSQRVTFVDHGLPMSVMTTGVQYIIRGVRGEFEGPASGVITVIFGTDAKGQRFASAKGASVKMAA